MSDRFSPSPIPDPWNSAMMDAGFINPRTDQPSLRQLADAAGVHAATAARTIRGITSSGRTNHDTIQGLARALNKPPVEIAEWIATSEGRATAAPDPYVGPAGSAALTQRQQTAVSTIITELMRANRRGAGRRALNSRLVVGLAREFGTSRTEMCEILARIEGADDE